MIRFHKAALVIFPLALACTLAGAEAPAVRAEAVATRAIWCPFLAFAIDGEPNDIVAISDVNAACDGLSGSDVDALGDGAGDEDGTLEPEDLEPLDLDANQITEAGLSGPIYESLYVFAFVDDDAPVTFDAEFGPTVLLNDDFNVDEAEPADDANPETCEGDDDADCGTSNPVNGDGVVVATIASGLANQGEAPDVDVAQENVGSVESLVVVGAPAEVMVARAEPAIQSDAAAACAQDGVPTVKDPAAVSDVESTLVIATVTDNDGVVVSRAQTSFDSGNTAIAEIGDASGVSFETNDYGIAALAVVCGGDSTGAVLISAGIVVDAGSVEITVVDVLSDSDADRLSDGDELVIGTDPFNPDTDFDGAGDGVEVLFMGTNPLNADTDGDGVLDGPAVGTSPPPAALGPDNCPLIANLDQLNTDAAPIANGIAIAADDATVPNADVLGDACDADDDNDALPDAGERSATACGPFDLSATGHPRPAGGDNTSDDDGDGSPARPMGSDLTDDGPSWDTDNDGVRDGVECALGTDPRDRLSRPSDTACGGLTDADGDGLAAAWEYCKWGTLDFTQDSDADGEGDCSEAADVDGDGVISFPGDLIPFASAFFSTGTDVVFDIDGDGVFSFAGDVITEASFFFGSRACA